MDVSSNGGMVKVNNTAPPSYPSDYEFNSATVVFLAAVPEFFYRFNYWDGDLSGATNPTTILIDCNKSINANFAIDWLKVGWIIGPLVLAGSLVFIFIIRR